jgi:hypothetical protein
MLPVNFSRFLKIFPSSQSVCPSSFWHEKIFNQLPTVRSLGCGLKTWKTGLLKTLDMLRSYWGGVSKTRCCVFQMTTSSKCSVLDRVLWQFNHCTAGQRLYLEGRQRLHAQQQQCDKECFQHKKNLSNTVGL